ncbi:MAG: DEAD/DEAH box helicase, partial [Firmicutes bacterium]|nr:DEAD/DEAH box helicase [Bacillota bacterium]
KRMSPLRPPSSDEALVGQQRLAVESLSEMVSKNNIGDYRSFVTELLEKHEAIDIIAAALKSMTREPSDTPVSISEERPLPSRKEGGGGRSGGGYKGNRSGGGGGRSSSGSSSRGYDRSGSRRSSGPRDGSSSSSQGTSKGGRPRTSSRRES